MHFADSGGAGADRRAAENGGTEWHKTAHGDDRESTEIRDPEFVAWHVTDRPWKKQRAANIVLTRCAHRPERRQDLRAYTPKVRQPYRGRACRRAWAVRAWVQMGGGTRLNGGCWRAGEWTGRRGRARASGCGWGSVWTWLRRGIAVAMATTDAALARVLSGAGVWLPGRVERSRQRPSRPGRMPAEGRSRDLNSAARAAMTSAPSHCQRSPNAKLHPHSSNLNFELGFSSFWDVSPVRSLNNANLKKPGIQVH
jgi:hypothetical protein